MILGIGLDWIETDRVEKSLERFGKRFRERVFLEAEIQYCESMKFPAKHYAARFAAKEAVSKAFGTGIGKSLGWKDVEIRRHPSGQPCLVFHGGGAKLAQERGVTQSFLSLTHHETAAAAVAVLCSD